MAGIDNDVRTYQDAYASGTQIPLSPSLVQLLALQRNEAARRAGANQQQLQQQSMPGTILEQKQQSQYAQQSPQDLAQRVGPTMQRQAAQEQQQMQQQAQQAPQGGQGLAGIQPQQFNEGGGVRSRDKIDEQAVIAVAEAKADGKSLDQVLADVDQATAQLRGAGGGGDAGAERISQIKEAIQRAWGPEEAAFDAPDDNSLEAILGDGGAQPQQFNDGGQVDGSEQQSEKMRELVQELKDKGISKDQATAMIASASRSNKAAFQEAPVASKRKSDFPIDNSMPDGLSGGTVKFINLMNEAWGPEEPAFDASDDGSLEAITGDAGAQVQAPQQQPDFDLDAFIQSQNAMSGDTGMAEYYAENPSRQTSRDFLQGQVNPNLSSDSGQQVAPVQQPATSNANVGQGTVLANEPQPYNLEGVMAELFGGGQQVDPQQTQNTGAQPSLLMPDAMFEEFTDAQVDPQQAKITAQVEAQTASTEGSENDLDGLLEIIKPDVAQTQAVADNSLRAEIAEPAENINPAFPDGMDKPPPFDVTPNSIYDFRPNPRTGRLQEINPRTGGPYYDPADKIDFGPDRATNEEMEFIRRIGYRGRHKGNMTVRAWQREMEERGESPRRLAEVRKEEYDQKLLDDPAFETFLEDLKLGEEEAKAEELSEQELALGRQIGGGPNSVASPTGPENLIEQQLAQVLGGGSESFAPRDEGIAGISALNRMPDIPELEFTSPEVTVEKANLIKKAMGLPEKATEKDIKAAQENARKLYTGELGNTETRKMLVSSIDNVQKVYDRAAARSGNRWNRISSFLRGMSGGTSLSSGLAMGSASMANNIDRLSNAEARAAKNLFDVTKELYASDMRIAEGAFNYADTVLERMKAQNQAIDQTDSARTNQVIQLDAMQDKAKNERANVLFEGEIKIRQANLERQTALTIAALEREANALGNSIGDSTKLMNLTTSAVELENLVIEGVMAGIDKDTVKNSKSDDPAIKAAAQQIILGAMKKKMEEATLPRTVQTIRLLQERVARGAGLPARVEETQPSTATPEDNEKADSFLERVFGTDKE